METDRKETIVCDNGAWPGLLFSILCRILTVRSQMQTFAHVRLPRQTCAREHFTFACTCFLYYNLCLCKSFKEHAPKGGANEVRPSWRRRPPLFCGCKGTTIPETGKLLKHFFEKKMNLYSIHIIYIIYARRYSLSFSPYLFTLLHKSPHHVGELG